MSAEIYTKDDDVYFQDNYRGVLLRGQIRRRTIDDQAVSVSYLGSCEARKRYVTKNKDYYWSKIIENFEAGRYKELNLSGSTIAIVSL